MQVSWAEKGESGARDAVLDDSCRCCPRRPSNSTLQMLLLLLPPTMPGQTSHPHTNTAQRT